MNHEEKVKGRGKCDADSEDGDVMGLTPEEKAVMRRVR